MTDKMNNQRRPSAWKYTDQSPSGKHSMLTFYKPDLVIPDGIAFFTACKQEDPDKTPSWKELLHDYTQDTTMHGIRFTTIRTKYNLRRVCWALAVLGLLSLLIYLVVRRLQYFYERPKAVNVEVTYKDKLTFPAVTICNQNPFKLTKVHENGLYDTFMEKYKLKPTGTDETKSSECYDKYSLISTSCLNMESFKVKTSHRYGEVTLLGCEQLCENVNNYQCSVIVHTPESRSCILTQLKTFFNASSTSMKDDCVPAHTYHRSRCAVIPDESCDFETDDCSDFLAQSFMDRDDWQRVKAHDKTPNKDRTTESGSGYYFQMLETKNRIAFSARLVTSYMLLTDKCLQLSYIISGEKAGQLTVFTWDEDLNQVPRARAFNINPSWRLMHVKLPNIVARIVIEGTRAKSGTSGIVMDDIILQDCSKFRSSTCKTTRSGLEYMGPLSVAKKNHKDAVCIPWAELDKKLLDPLRNLFPDGSPNEASNYCRNPAGMYSEPSCYVINPTSKRIELATCGIPFCACKEYEDSCEDGKCIPMQLSCDGTSDCPTGSDEVDQCGDKRKIECEFEDDFFCGYHPYSISRVEWEGVTGMKAEWQNAAKTTVPGYMKLTANGAFKGERAILHSPLTSVEVESCLHFDYALQTEGDNAGTIRIYQKESVDPLVGRHLMSLSKLGSGTASVDIIPGPSKRVSIAFEATIGQLLSNFIAIAKIRLDPGLCNPDPDVGSCKSDEFQCFSKECILKSQTCDGYDDCPGGDDEVTPCAADISLQCDFNKQFKCGYTVRSSFETFSWLQELEQSYEDTTPEGPVVRYTIDGGTACTFPFTYNGKEFSNCISYSASGYPMCDGYYCQPDLFTVKTSRGFCVFPFLYDGNKYSTCLKTKDGQAAWCALTDNYDRDKRLGYCDVSCGGILTDIEGKITSPSFPNVYPQDIACHYLIKGPIGTTISVSFEHVDLEAETTSSCYDYVNIHDGEDFRAAVLLEELCGKKRPADLKSTGNSMSIYFYSDDYLSLTGFSLTYKMHLPQNLGKMMSSRFTGTLMFAEAQAYLNSPWVEVSQESCLSFTFMARTGLTVSRIEIDKTYTELLHTDMDHGKAWHKTYLPITPGKFSIRFNNYQGVISGASQITTGSSTMFISAIDNIQVTAKTCEKLTEQKTSIACDFTDIDMCGYSDFTDHNKWTRIKRGDKYFMVGHGSESSPSDIPVLLSGVVQAQNATCVTLSMLPNASEAYMYILAFPPPYDVDNHIFLQEFDLYEATVFRTLVSLPGEFRLAIYLISGTALIENIDINGTEVDPELCRESAWSIQTDHYDLGDYYSDFETDVEFKDEFFGSGFSGSGDGSGFSGDSGSGDVDNEDESENSTAEANITSAMPTATQDPGDIGNGGDIETTTVSTTTIIPSLPPEAINISNLALDAFQNVSDFYQEAGHQKSDFVYRCLYSSKQCNDDKLMPKITDQGYCMTFNNEDTDVIQSFKTGSGFGLKLTLNVEQYEYIDGPNTDAGIKMYLHKQSEIPAVRDLGFAVAPGVHGLVAATFSRTEMLSKPYGECGEAKLNLTLGEEYTYHRCQQECETLKAYNVCNCIDAYMPGEVKNWKTCSLQQYLECIYGQLPTSNKTVECDCPDACNVTAYGTELSNAALSALSVDNILTENVTELQKQYQHALEIRHRVEVHRLEEVLFNLQNISLMYDSFKLLGAEQTKTIIIQVMEAARKMLEYTVLFKKDASGVKHLVDQWQKSYDLGYKEASVMVKAKLAEFVNMMGLVKWAKATIDDSSSEWSDLIMELQGNARELYQSLQWQSALAGMTKTDKPDALAQRVNRQLPSRLWPSKTRQEKCQQTLVDLMEFATKMKNAYVSYLTTKRVDNTITASHEWELCEKEYEGQLARVSTVAQSVLTEVNVEIADLKPDSNLVSLDFSQEVADITRMVDWFSDLARQYGENKITRLQLANKLLGQDIMVGVEANMSSVRSNLKNNAVSPLRVKLRELNSKVSHWYSSLLNVLIKIEGFFSQGEIETFARGFYIWRSPKVAWFSSNIVQFHIAKDQVWRVWPTGTTMENFLKDKAKPALKTIVTDFLDPLLKELDKVDLLLMHYQSKVTNAVGVLQGVLKNFKDKVVLDKNFIFNNFLRLDIYFAALKYEAISQMKAYKIENYFSEIGGYMGLLIGASCMTLCEVLDLFLYNCILKCTRGRDKRRQVDSQIHLTTAYEQEQKRSLTPVTDVY